MANPFDQFDAPQANPFDQFDTAPKPIVPTPAASPTKPAEKSFGLGLYEGGWKPFDNAALAMSKIPVIGPALDQLGQAIGLPSTQQAVAEHKQHVANRIAQGVEPGGVGKFIGETAATLPVAVATKNPWAAGAGIGALLSDKDTPLGVATDAGIGALGGKAADWGIHALAKAATPVGRAIARKLSEYAAYNPEMVQASNKATDYVRGLIDTSGKTIDDLRAAAADYFGKPVTAAEAIGPQGVSHLRALGIRQGETGNTLRGLLDERAESYRDRAMEDLGEAAGIVPEAARGDIDAFVERGRQAANPLFDQALSTPGPVWNDGLRVLAQRPKIASAIQGVSDDLLNMGEKPGVYGLPSGPDDKALLPTAQAWDMVKKRLGQMVERDQFGRPIPDSMSPNNSAIKIASRDLTNALKKSIPGYSDALAASGDYLSAKSAFDRGGDFINKSTVTAKQMADHFDTLSDQDKQAFLGGVVNKIFDKAQTTNFLPSTFNKPILKQKLTAVLGKDQAETFLSKMAAEAKLRASGQRMYPGLNSPTADMAAAFGEQNNPLTDVAQDAAWMGVHLASGNKAHAIGRALSLVNRLGAWKNTTGTSVPFRDEAGRLLMMTPDQLADHLETVIDPADPQMLAKVSNIISQFARPASIGTPLALSNALSAPTQSVP